MHERERVATGFYDWPLIWPIRLIWLIRLIGLMIPYNIYLIHPL